MRVARLHSVGDVRLGDEPTPIPDSGETLVNVTAVGLCGSDLHWFSEAGIGDVQLERPLVLGHEFAGENAAVKDAIAAARPGGRVVLVGIPDDDCTSFSASIARRRGLTVKLSRRMKHNYPRTIWMVESGTVDVRSLVTHRLPLVTETFAVWQRHEGTKVVVAFD